MKSKYMQKLHEDFLKYSTQIGILPEDTPQLVTNKKQMDDIKSQWPNNGRRGSSTSNNYGICYRKQKVIL